MEIEKIDELIVKWQKEQLDQRWALFDAQDKLSRIQLDTTFGIQEETDENGKRLYSNETARKKALNEKLGLNSEFVELMKKIKHTKHDLELRQIEIDSLERKFVILNGRK